MLPQCCRGRLSRQDPHRASYPGRYARRGGAAIAQATTTHKKVTLAVLDDPGRGSDLLGRLRSVGTWAIDALQNCKQGAHHGLTGDLRPFVREAEKLAEWLQK